MKFGILIPLIFIFEVSLYAQGPTDLHSDWSRLLNEFVDDQGQVDYRGFLGESTRLDKYLARMASNDPTDGWSEEEKIAYYVNLYNAATIRLILDHYPLKSIRDIKGPNGKGPWQIEFVKTGGKTYSLDHIEHGILRKDFNEPRIHFALVCAAVSCPPLRNEAFTGKDLDQQLSDSGIKFLSDETKNSIGRDKVQISMIFQWFESDFTRNTDLLSYLADLSGKEIRSEASIEYIEYDWRLNEKK